MNLTVFSCGDAVFTDLECIKGYAYEMADLGDIVALFARRAPGFGCLRDNSAHFDTCSRLLLFEFAA